MTLNSIYSDLIRLESTTKQYWYLFHNIIRQIAADGKEYAILGNPNLGEIRIFFLGVENRKRPTACAEVWFNELRLGNLNEKGGWAALGRVDFKLADLGTLYVSAGAQESGFWNH